MQIVQLDATVVVGVPVTARFDELGRLVPAAWQQLFQRCDELPQPDDGLFAEASFSLGDGLYHETVGVPLKGDVRVQGPWSLALIPAGRFVVHRFTGSVENIGLGFQEIYDWASTEGLGLGSYKLDVGYTAGGSTRPHGLHIDIID
jgi:predicted transcriptional regulator YdeE